MLTRFQARIDGYPPCYHAFPGGRRVVVGRARACEIILLDHNLAIRHRSVEEEGGRLRLLDHGSVHGTYVNGQRLDPRQRLASSQTI